tara:strand:+ start:212 stop:505 length:294 start_codon:yes stop_codon:yes gene_type:complete
MPITYESKEKILEREKREKEQYLENQSRIINKHTPPQIGQYAYFDSRIQSRIQDPIFGHDYWLAVTNRGHFNCHYSSIEEKHGIPFVTCQGIIQELI